jgi:two-component system chemotaxis sensor kinase CheA
VDAEVSSPPAASPEGAPSSQGHRPRPKAHEEGTTTTLRVGAAKLDTLVELSSDLVAHVFRTEGHATLARRLASRLLEAEHTSPHLRADPELREVLRQARQLSAQLVDFAGESLRLSDELQSAMRSLAMVRIDGLATVLKRSVREVCSASGTSASLRLVGGHTEVDRAMLEGLRDPLVHLVRNAVAHGVEPPEERRLAGKPEAGSVEVEARSMGPWVDVVVRDDGRGIDLQQVRTRALEAGVASPGQLDEMGESELLDLLFRGGISTATEVTEYAGRGVGLDVVRTHLRKLGGEASLSSTHGQGAQVRLRVPLTRLTTTGVLVQIGEQAYAVPTADVERTLKIDIQDIKQVNGAEVISVEDQLVRVVHGGAAVCNSAATATGRFAVIIGDGPRRRALTVDEVLGQRELLLQPLCWNLEAAPAIAGSTVLDAGDVVLVLDAHALARIGQTVRSAQRPARRTPRLLVVDDSATSRTLERNILRAAGYEVLTAVTGTEATQTLTSEQIDLVISDVEMPQMDGLELTRWIRSHDDLGALPVVLVTSLGSESQKLQGAEAGADAYIVKGEFEQDELLRTVARLL